MKKRTLKLEGKVSLFTLMIAPRNSPYFSMPSVVFRGRTISEAGVCPSGESRTPSQSLHARIVYAVRAARSEKKFVWPPGAAAARDAVLSEFKKWYIRARTGPGTYHVYSDAGGISTHLSRNTTASSIPCPLTAPTSHPPRYVGIPLVGSCSPSSCPSRNTGARSMDSAVIHSGILV